MSGKLTRLTLLIIIIIIMDNFCMALLFIRNELTALGMVVKL